MENHSNINNQFIPYNLALELKGLGFKNNWNFKEYDTMGYLQHTGLLDSHKLEAIDAPLWQQAFRFFREKYMLSGEIYIFKNFWNFDIEDINNSIQLYTSDITSYSTYEEAELECLKKLIEIVKNESK